MKRIYGLCALVFVLLCQQICTVSARVPKTSKIAFQSNRDGNDEIYLMNPDGTQQINLTQHPSGDFSPVWSPTGEEILFQSNRDGKFDLYLMDANGKNVRAIFREGRNRNSPSWSPDGKRIAYASNGFIYISTRDGKNIEKVVQGRAPVWSPNGKWIAFIPMPPVEIRLLNTETGEQEPIFRIQLGGRLEDVSWAPNSERLAFSGIDRAFWQQQTIYTLNRNGTMVKRVLKPKSPFWVEAVTWAPRGDELLYVQRSNGQSQIFKIGLMDRRGEQLTHEGNFNSDAHWFDPVGLQVQPQANLLTTRWGELKQK